MDVFKRVKTEKSLRWLLFAAPCTLESRLLLVDSHKYSYLVGLMHPFFICKFAHITAINKVTRNGVLRCA